MYSEYEGIASELTVLQQEILGNEVGSLLVRLAPYADTE